eukprot:TRINITY_DN21187_c0_g1_i1.p1 TRINITY_DN21187_c0_g1~~TRINITY_DN21187_c0_g1_i1.p1  ORF type:complete len:329 (+),score=21.30 TRINITY_DN21187_c0_g1_i1:78-1064(+)
MAFNRNPSVGGAGHGDAGGAHAQRVSDIEVVHDQQMSSLCWSKNPFGVLTYAALGILDAAKVQTTKWLVGTLGLMFIIALSALYVASVSEPGGITCALALTLSSASEQAVFVRPFSGLANECEHWYRPTLFVPTLLTISGRVLADSTLYLYGHIAAKNGMRKVVQDTLEQQPGHWMQRVIHRYLWLFTEYTVCIQILAVVYRMQLSFTFAMLDVHFRGTFITSTVGGHLLRLLLEWGGYAPDAHCTRAVCSGMVFFSVTGRMLRIIAKKAYFERADAHVEALSGQPAGQLRPLRPVSQVWAGMGSLVAVTCMGYVCRSYYAGGGAGGK